MSSDELTCNIVSSITGHKSKGRSEMSEESSNEALEVNDDNACSNKSEKKLNIQSVPNPPFVAVREKIVVCIDNFADKSLGYTFTNPEPTSLESNSYSIRNQALVTLFTNKLLIAKDSEFGITVIEDGDNKWLLPLTYDVEKFSESLADLKPVVLSEQSSICDITSIFSSVLNKIEIPVLTNKPTVMPPPYVIRLLLVYGNSQIVPTVNKSNASYLKFIMSPYCVFDIIYLHEKQSDFNNVEQIYKSLGEIVSPRSYVLECSRNVTKVFNNMAKLLAHPYQRVPQGQWRF